MQYIVHVFPAMSYLKTTTGRHVILSHYFYLVTLFWGFALILEYCVLITQVIRKAANTYFPVHCPSFFCTYPSFDFKGLFPTWLHCMWTKPLGGVENIDVIPRFGFRGLLFYCIYVNHMFIPFDYEWKFIA